MSSSDVDLAVRLAALETQLATQAVRLWTLEARSAIADAVLRFGRGLDRLDRDLMMSAFHPDATVDYGVMFGGPIGEFLDFAFRFQRPEIPVQHMTGNVLIVLHGSDSASVESYELARHPANPGIEGDMILASRLLDRFALREGEWRIAARRKIGDWARIHAGANGLPARLPLLKARRDREDPSYAVMDAAPAR